MWWSGRTGGEPLEENCHLGKISQLTPWTKDREKLCDEKKRPRTQNGSSYKEERKGEVEESPLTADSTGFVKHWKRKTW